MRKILPLGAIPPGRELWKADCLQICKKSPPWRLFHPWAEMSNFACAIRGSGTDYELKVLGVTREWECTALTEAQVPLASKFSVEGGALHNLSGLKIDPPTSAPPLC